MKTIIVQEAKVIIDDIVLPDVRYYEPTTDIKWIKKEEGYCLIQRWKCRYPEMSLLDIWILISIVD
jgi:hypothetical protein